MKDHLQQQITELIAEITHVAPSDRVGDLVGLLDRVGGDGLEVLFEVPRTAAARRPQRGHDDKELIDIAGRFQGRPPCAGMMEGWTVPRPYSQDVGDAPPAS